MDGKLGWWVSQWIGKFMNRWMIDGKKKKDDSAEV